MKVLHYFIILIMIIPILPFASAEIVDHFGDGYDAGQAQTDARITYDSGWDYPGVDRLMICQEFNLDSQTDSLEITAPLKMIELGNIEELEFQIRSFGEIKETCPLSETEISEIGTSYETFSCEIEDSASLDLNNIEVCIYVNYIDTQVSESYNEYLLVQADSSRSGNTKVYDYFSGSWTNKGFNQPNDIAISLLIDEEVVEAGKCDPGYFKLFEISDKTNAHACRDCDYEYEVCAKNEHGDLSAEYLYGNYYTTNPVFYADIASLSFDINAHVGKELSKDINHITNIQVSYSSSGRNPPDCVWKGSLQDCADYSEYLFSISDDTNAHIGYADAYSGTGWVLCCNFNQPPTITIDEKNKVTNVGEEITFDPEVVDAEEDDVFSRWNIIGKPEGSEPLVDYNIYSATLTPDMSGEYIMEFKVADCQFDNPDCKSISTETVTVTVESDFPVADFTKPEFCIMGKPCEFVSTSIDPDDEELMYNWNLGDGAVSSTETVSHTYSTPGSYLVELNVTDIAQLSDTKQQAIEVYIYGDFNLDQIVNYKDLANFGVSWGAQQGDDNYDPLIDHNEDGIVNYKELVPFGKNWGTEYSENFS